MDEIGLAHVKSDDDGKWLMGQAVNIYLLIGPGWAGPKQPVHRLALAYINGRESPSPAMESVHLSISYAGERWAAAASL